MVIGLTAVLVTPVAANANQNPYELRMRHVLRTDNPRPGDVIIAIVTVRNSGTKTIPLVKLRYTVTGAQAFYGTPPGQSFKNLRPGRRGRMALAIKVLDNAQGHLCHVATATSRVLRDVAQTRLCFDVQTEP